jgi:hypothetical protein
MPVRRQITALAVATVSAIAMPGAASAEPGLTVDPHSPAGVEYQVPLDTARGHGSHPGGASGDKGSGSSGSSADPGGSNSDTLFGSGITPAAKTRSSAGGRHGDNGKRSAAPRPRAGHRAAAAPPVAPITASASYSPDGALVGLIAGILAVGVGIGLLARYRSRRLARQTPPSAP